MSELVVPEALEGAPLDRVLRELLGGSWAAARALVTSGKVRVEERPARAFTRPMHAGERIVVDMRAPSPRVREVRAFEARLFVHVDSSVAVVRKPAGINTVAFVPRGDEAARDPSKRPPDDETPLDDSVRRALERRERLGARAPLGVVQRLDKETSGLIVFTRTLRAKRALEAQLRGHTMHRLYLAIAHGDVRGATHRTAIGADRGDGLRGEVPHGGQHAVTHVTPLERLGGATLVACRLETGRTHQIRIHLAESGHPLVGEPVYVRDYRGPVIEAPRLMLHATELGFTHPVSGEALRFRDEPPADFQRVLGRLRSTRHEAPAERSPSGRHEGRPSRTGRHEGAAGRPPSGRREAAPDETPSGRVNPRRRR